MMRHLLGHIGPNQAPVLAQRRPEDFPEKSIVRLFRTARADVEARDHPNAKIQATKKRIWLEGKLAQDVRVRHPIGEALKCRPWF
jgi:hypothetical protein